MEFILKTNTGSNRDMIFMSSAFLENIGGLGRKIHASPGDIGKIAAESGAGSPVLSQTVAGGLVEGKKISSNSAPGTTRRCSARTAWYV